MLNIVIPMAGRGSRFADAGYKNPKPLINVMGEPMIVLVTRNLKPKCEHRFIYICQKDHLEQYNLEEILRKGEPNCIIIPITYITEGAACTVLLAEEFIDNDDQLMIANSDQYVDIDINEYLEKSSESDGLIMTMPASGKKWSYIKYNDKKEVTLVREKEEISNEATVGIYNYLRGSDFVKGAKKMIDRNERVNDEFYVAPVYNILIEEGKIIHFYNIGDKMHGIGTPEDLKLFCNQYLKDHIR